MPVKEGGIFSIDGALAKSSSRFGLCQGTTSVVPKLQQKKDFSGSRPNRIPPMGMGGEGVSSVCASRLECSLLFDGAPLKRNHLQSSAARLAISLDLFHVARWIL